MKLLIFGALCLIAKVFGSNPPEDPDKVTVMEDDKKDTRDKNREPASRPSSSKSSGKKPKGDKDKRKKDSECSNCFCGCIGEIFSP